MPFFPLPEREREFIVGINNTHTHEKVYLFSLKEEEKKTLILKTEKRKR
jgi:hypothetical protein